MGKMFQSYHCVIEMSIILDYEGLLITRPAYDLIL